MITPVSGIKTPSFKGTEKSDENKVNIKDVSSHVDAFVKEGNETLNSVSEGLKETTESVGAITITGSGLCLTVGKLFKPITEFFTKVVTDEQGLPIVLERLNEKTGEMEKVAKRAPNWIKIGIAAGIAVIGSTVAIVKGAKAKKAKKAAEAERQKDSKETQQTKESDKTKKTEEE